MDLSRFGFTPTESRVYVALLRLGPATGYAVALEAGLARANVYAALEALSPRGIVARLPGRPVRYAPSDPATVVTRLELDWRRDLDALARDLAAVERAPVSRPPDGAESLEGREAVLDRVRACARSAGEELLAVVGPWARDVFAELEGAGRGRTVRVLSLGSPAPRGALLRPAPLRQVAAYWGGLPVAVVADRRSAVCALLDEGEREGRALVTTHPALVPYLRHLLRREFASTSREQVS
jgi:sugar-specific transcriptional regulator TrmB